MLKIRLLGDTLVKKRELLCQILGITENQETILIYNQESSELSEMFLEMNEEKQKLINELLQADTFFQKIFNDISPEFEENSVRHKSEILKLQELIRLVTDLDVKIRIQERKNRDAIRRSGSKAKIPVPKAPKDYVLKQYELNAQITKKNKYRKK